MNNTEIAIIVRVIVIRIITLSLTDVRAKNKTKKLPGFLADIEKNKLFRYLFFVFDEYIRI